MIRKATLVFKKNVPTDLTSNDRKSSAPDEIKVGSDIYTMVEYQRTMGHDDSLPYNAILCLNGKRMAKVWNDGWGGMSEIEPLDTINQVRIASAESRLKYYKWKCGIEIELRMDFIADMLAMGCETRNK